MIQGVSQEMDIAALTDRLREHFGNGALESRVIIRDHKLHPPQPPAVQLQEHIMPTYLAFPVGQLDRQDLPSALIVDPDGALHAWLRITPPGRTFS
jgi:hypothetical protein